MILALLGHEFFWGAMDTGGRGVMTRTLLRTMLEYCSPLWMNPMLLLRGMWYIASSQVTMILLEEGSTSGGNRWYTVTIYPTL